MRLQRGTKAKFMDRTFEDIDVQKLKHLFQEVFGVKPPVEIVAGNKSGDEADVEHKSGNGAGNPETTTGNKSYIYHISAISLLTVSILSLCTMLVTYLYCKKTMKICVISGLVVLIVVSIVVSLAFKGNRVFMKIVILNKFIKPRSSRCPFCVSLVFQKLT